MAGGAGVCDARGRQGSQMLKLKRLKILRYRNVLPGSELRFDDGLNLVLGVNASGKTTLLALLSAVCRSVFEGIKHEEFELEYELASARFTIEVRVSHREGAMTEVERALSSRLPMDDRYNVRVIDSDLGSERSFSADTPPASGRSPVDLMGEQSLLFRLLLLSGERDTWPLLDALRALENAFRFDESLDVFTAATGRTVVVASSATPSVWYATGRCKLDENSSAMNCGSFIPRALVNEMSGMGATLREMDQLMQREDPRDFEWLPALARYLGVRNVVCEPRKVREDKKGGYTFQGFEFEVERSDGVTIHHDLLSYGQKRLLSFFYYLACNPAVVIADELVNGLHHRWIDACMKEIGPRQAFLTSQNPLLFDYAEFESVEQVERRFLVCGLETVDGREMMVWRNMSRADAEVFYRAYEAGIEHVGDILITRGLW